MVYEARRNLGFLCCSKHLDDTGTLGCVPNFFLNLCIVGGTATVGIVIPLFTTAALNFIIDFVGSTCSPTMVFVLPALFFLKATSGNDNFCCHRVIAYILLIFGVLVIPICLTLWALGIACSAQGANASEWCCDLGINANGTCQTTASTY
mgnify:CR=1 FL=1